MFISRRLLIVLWLAVFLISVMIYLCATEISHHDSLDNHDQYAAAINVGSENQ
jgi:sensor domain CHASE-containing protein